MPIYNPYNEVVQPAKYVAPMDLNLLLKGTQYKQEQSEKNFNEIQGQVNNLLSIPAYGKDKEILNQKLQELQQVMGGLDVTNLETPQAKQQINSLINQFSQDKDVQAIAQRGNSYQNMMAEKQDFDKKGKIYVNSGLRKLNQYYSGDDYIRDVKFSNDGYEAPNVVEAMKKIKELETPEEKQIPDGNGGYTIVKSYNPERLKKTTEQVLSGMPNWEKFNREQLAQKYEGIDIDKYAIEHYTPLQQLSQQNYDAALFGYSNSIPGSEDQKKYALAATKAKQDLDQATSILNNPYHGQAFLETEYQNMKEKAVNDIQNALNFNAEGENKMYRAIEQARGFQHDFAIKAVEHKYRMGEIKAREDAAINKIQELQRLKSLAGNISDPLSRKLIEMGIKKGLTSELLNEEGTGFKTNAELVALGLEPDEQENKPKGEIVRQSTESFREIYNMNKDVVEKAIKDKAGALGFFFDADDIEELTWDKETNRYTVKVDDAGTTQDISFTQDEIDNMSTVKYSKNGEVISIPLTDPDAKAAIEEAEKLGYKKQ